MESAGVHLTRTPELSGEIDALADRYGGRVGLDAVLGDLDRRLRRTWAPGLAVGRAWTWERRDRGDRLWWPQGIAVARGGGRAAVSWYAKTGGSRVSVLDLEAGRYRHVELVVPTAHGHEPLRVHAGGLAWQGPHLHVAATARGFWTCRTDDVVRTPQGYLLPVRFGYRAQTDEGAERLRYSFLSVDRTSRPARLVAGEYGSRKQTRRLAHFDLDPGTGLLATDDAGSCRPEVVDDGVVRAQGCVVVDGRYHLTASHGPWKPGSLWTGRPGAFREHRFAVPMGPEDLDHEPDRDELWTVTEHPHRRWVVAVRRTRVD